MGKQGSFIKRFTDIVISIISLLLTLPIFIVSAVAIKLESKGPVFFIQKRAGLNGRAFNMIKFRGMIDNALNYGPELTQQNDPRVTKVGRFLRRTSIDELPQFINVLKGEMSIIGPRPEILSITSKYSSEHKEVFKYMPGITGYSQINGRQMLTPDQRTKMEIDYYNNETFWGDFKIMFNTIFVVISNKGNL
ncbi:MAG: sugar transferase [Ignavibacteriales bacterium]|nr:sugar transferase [Ignavibacteriales bacterium]